MADKPQTNFDRYMAELRQDAAMSARLEAASQAWDVALQLAALREARGLTQKQVADMLGTKQQAIARLEDPSYRRHSLSMVQRYVAALGAGLDITIIPSEQSADYDARRCPKPLLPANPA